MIYFSSVNCWSNRQIFMDEIHIDDWFVIYTYIYIHNTSKEICTRLLLWHYEIVNTSRLRQTDWHFANDISKYIFLNENYWISNNVSLKCVPYGPIDNVSSLVQVLAWHRIPIIWTNYILVYWCMYASLRLNEVIMTHILHASLLWLMCTTDLPYISYVATDNEPGQKARLGLASASKLSR